MSIEIHDNSKEVSAAIKEALLRGLEKCGLVAEGYAKKLCPVDTGNLRNSITHQVDSEGHSVYVGTNSDYGAYVELGTGKYYPGGRPTPWAPDERQQGTALFETGRSGARRPISGDSEKGTEKWIMKRSRLLKPSLNAAMMLRSGEKAMGTSFWK